MDLKQFYKQVEKIVLYPGSVDDLNRMEKLTNSGKHYNLVPIKGSTKYLTGPIIPGPNQFKELIDTIQFEADDELKITASTQKLAFTQKLEELVMQTYGDLDIRMKAQEIGAHGLVHVQLYNKERVYMGVPVKLEK